MLDKIVIANRGEIALRIWRACRELGIKTVAVHSTADRDLKHVRLADESVCIGPPAAAQSYLNIPAVISAAEVTDAVAIHPGYGFLAENADFAEACRAAGLTFIGPSAEAIRVMGNKAAAKRRMAEAGVPLVPGYQGEDQADETLIAEAEKMGFPVMVKAAAGGGGRGMRLVADTGKLVKALSGARREAGAAFGSDELILEKAIHQARHVEIQVFGDAFGTILHLGERDCSIQRRHQKVIEEAPSPAVDADIRDRMGQAAVAAARAIDYCGAGTVEFLLDADGRFFFLEMNTRLQVEHPVTERVTGFDLVAWQLRIAAGEPLPVAQDQVAVTGHAIEARLYAEDPTRNFLPQTGRIALWDPPAGPGIRVDHGLIEGQIVTPHYDPMIAKVVAWGESRDVARRRLARALEDLGLMGLTTNRAFLVQALSHPTFARGGATTTFIDAHLPKAARARPEVDAATVALAAALLHDAAAAGQVGFRSTGPAAAPLLLVEETAGQSWPVSVLATAGERVVTVGEARLEIAILARNSGARVRVGLGSVQETVRALIEPDGALTLQRGGWNYRFRDEILKDHSAEATVGDGTVVAPMNGKILAVDVGPGDTVRRGQRLMVLEAMKMEHEISAGSDGQVTEVAVKVGDQVGSRAVLAMIDGRS